MLVVPILWNLAQNLTDVMVDALDTAFDVPGDDPGGNFAALRHRPMTEKWMIERISGHITIEMNRLQNTDLRDITLVHAGILCTESDDDGLVILSPQFNSDALKPWVWKDQIPISSSNPVSDTSYQLYGVPSVQHRTINVKTRRRLKPETAINLILQTDTQLATGVSVLVSPMLRAYVTRTQ